MCIIVAQRAGPILFTILVRFSLLSMNKIFYLNIQLRLPDYFEEYGSTLSILPNISNI